MSAHLRHTLLAVPEYRHRYPKYIGAIANTWLDWNRLGPMVARDQKLIADDVAKDTRKLDTTEAFLAGIHGADGAPPAPTTLRGFADARRTFLLAHPEIVRAGGRWKLVSGCAQRAGALPRRSTPARTPAASFAAGPVPK